MHCFLCGKKIGFFRSLADQQYCCANHRREAGLASAQALRDEEDTETWASSRSKKKGGAKSGTSPAGQAGAVLAFVAIGGAMVAVLMMGGSGKSGGGGGAFASVSAETGKKPSMISGASSAVSDFVRGIAPVTLRQSFGGGSLGSAVSSAAEWSNLTLRAGATQIDDPRDWIGKTKTSASLRLWKKSTAMQNYEMEFQGQLEKTSLSWAVRAADAGNYYATKLAIIKAGPLPNAGLIRYAMVNGRETDRYQVPLPVTLERGAAYRIRVTVNGDQIRTYLGSTMIGAMTDKRLVRGGVGFFDDAGDPQKVAWVSVSEHDSFLGRLLANFALFVIPGERIEP
ncbi:MAG: hypothetical protein ABIR70_18300 [Bryobacteraceae bacterium]